ncbi:MAG: hypothetical protein ACR2L1_08505 [Pyrinomonadaceae bacterium]
MFNNLTLGSYFYIFLGLLLFGGGGYVWHYWRMYPLAMGLVFLGIGSVLCGITNGFADYSATGRLLWRIGAPILLIGLALTGYGMYRFV